tara:strand:- start:399 stop:1745 length:1347 start_codon:yes stop_codon:yes gene_type:complete
MIKVFFRTIILSITTLIYASPGDASAIFLLISPGASAVGSGEAQVAKADDAYASYFNPAGLGFQTGSEFAGMHVNWLPGLADDIYYEFIAYKKNIPWLGTVGGNFTFLNLGEQQSTDEFGNSLGKFRSYMWAASLSYGTKINETTAWGTNFKIIYQKLADEAVAAETGSGKPYSTDFAFDIGFLKKYERLNLGLSISNIGPEVDFIDKSQADPLPTNMKIGLFTTLYNDNSRKLNLLFDANKMLVARYESMDWNGNGVIDSGKEEGYFDPWYKAIYTSWLDDWHYGGDRNILNNGEQDTNSQGQSIIGGYQHFEEDGIPGITDGDSFIRTEDSNGNLLDYTDPNYGIYNSDGVKEKGTGDDRKFSDELEDMVYNIGLEFWYTENFALRLGYLHDKEGNLKHPTLGAGINFGQYGFDLGYILGKEGEPRSNTLLFSLNMSLDAITTESE